MTNRRFHNIIENVFILVSINSIVYVVYSLMAKG